MICQELTHKYFEFMRAINNNENPKADSKTISVVHALGLCRKIGQRTFLTPDGETALADYEEVGGFDK